MKEIKALTALRGIFALWVFLFHLGTWSPEPGWDQLPIVSRGYLAVDFFFVLSGYVLGRRHGQEFSGSFSSKTFFNFVGKRVGRMFPLHLFVLAACLAILLCESDHLRWWVYIVAEAALVHRWGIFPESSTTLNPPDWSISTEWAASLLFPLFAVMGLRGRGRAALMACVCGGAIVVVAWRHEWSMDVAFGHSWLPLTRCLAEFGIGMLLSRRAAPRWLCSDSCIAILLFGLIAITWLGFDLPAVGVEICVVAALAVERGIIVRFLELGPFHWLGEVSYSIYLVQIPALLLMRAFAVQAPVYAMAIYVVGSVAAVVGVSAATYHFIELPGIRLIRLVLRRAPA